MENSIEKNMEHEMDSKLHRDHIGIPLILRILTSVHHDTIHPDL